MIILFSILAFVTLIVILNSVVFSIREVRGNCFNSGDQALIARVADASGIELYKNIITLNKTKAEEKIEAALGSEVKVINIERKFPNTVWIHFVKLIPVLAIEKSKDVYVTCDNNLDVVGTDVPASSLLIGVPVDEVDKNIDGEKRPVVRVKISGGVKNPAPKAPLDLENGNSLAGLRLVVDTINRLDYFEYDLVRLLEEIDMTEYDDAVNPTIFLIMRGGGRQHITIEIQNAKKFLLQKIQHMISLYEKYLSGEISYSDWVIYNNYKNEIFIAAQ